MSIWMVIAAIWAMFAICVVLFVRGASPRFDRSDDERNERPRAGESSGVKV